MFFRNTLWKKHSVTLLPCYSSCMKSSCCLQEGRISCSVLGGGTQLFSLWKYDVSPSLMSSPTLLNFHMTCWALPSFSTFAPSSALKIVAHPLSLTALGWYFDFGQARSQLVSTFWHREELKEYIPKSLQSRINTETLQNHLDRLLQTMQPIQPVDAKIQFIGEETWDLPGESTLRAMEAASWGWQTSLESGMVHDM